MRQILDMPDPWFLLYVMHVQINEPAIYRKVRQIRQKASTIEGDNKTAWLMKAITCIDLTTLAGDDTPATVKALCRKAVNPVTSTDTSTETLHTAAVCVYPSRISDARAAVKEIGSSKSVGIAAVAGGFPSGQYPLSTRLQEIKLAAELGADEIDIVIDRSLGLTHNWIKLLQELTMIRAAAESKTMKAILSTGELFSLKDVFMASMLAMKAGFNFIKTSTGKETVNATLPVGIVMCRAIKEFYRHTQIKVGFKPAGGIKTVQDALEWMVLVETELGDEWLDKNLFRLGASSLLDNITPALGKS